MHQIRVTISSTIEVGTEPTDLAAAVRLLEEARRNKAKVVDAALSVEKQLGDIVAHYFASGAGGMHAEFLDHIVHTDWCSFAAKLKICSWLASDKVGWPGRQASEWTDRIRKAMKWRNAFAHGAMHHANGAVSLRFFEATPKAESLTDAFLQRVERELSDAHAGAHDLGVALGAWRAASDTATVTSPPPQSSAG